MHHHAYELLALQTPRERREDVYNNQGQARGKAAPQCSAVSVPRHHQQTAGTGSAIHRCPFFTRQLRQHGPRALLRKNGV